MNTTYDKLFLRYPVTVEASDGLHLLIQSMVSGCRVKLLDADNRFEYVHDQQSVLEMCKFLTDRFCVEPGVGISVFPDGYGSYSLILSFHPLDTDVSKEPMEFIVK